MRVPSIGRRLSGEPPKGDAVVAPPVAVPEGPAPAGHFRQLWLGNPPLSRIFWQDMMVGGTLINVLAMVAAFLLFGLDAPTWIAGTVFFSPVPYNLLLLIAVWRSSARDPSEWAWPARIAAVVWFGLMLFI
jgi:hypothetical protein